jgi:hypothetical protein
MNKSVVQRNASITTTTLKNRKTTMKKTILTILGAVALSCALFSQQARADSVSFFGGTMSATGASPGSPTVTVSFSSGWSVLAGSGVFAGTSGAPVTLNPYTFSGDGTGAACTNCPISPQWTYTSGGHTYTFTLTGLTNVHTAATSMSATGVGYVVVDNTGPHIAASWSTSGTGANFMYNNTTSIVSTTTVPDGGSAVALLGVAMTGIEGLRRLLRRRRA